ncbi:hypothetical protein LTR84_000267 [Exophiala bonariae]|uniref:RING-type domain-containing protein n=1 Tax=Exophiala bonariae TaxID=1690606 RepID=A0AAV9NQ38_9EURO|nr:hypothetical protein LTR84_000267 [Exophiala bonariae]
MDVDGWPPPKRRKVEEPRTPRRTALNREDDSDSSLYRCTSPRQFIGNYLSIVQRQFEVTNCDPNIEFRNDQEDMPKYKEQWDPASNQGLIEVVIQSIDSALPSEMVVKRVQGSQTPFTLKIRADSSTDLQLLEDIQYLDTSKKAEKRFRDQREYLHYSKTPEAALACVMSRLLKSPLGTFLEISILWNKSSAIKDRVDPTLVTILDHWLPGELERSDSPEPWNPREFYDNVHVPEKTEANSAELQIMALESNLFPFQRRAVRWLLAREGVCLGDNGRPAPLSMSEDDLPEGFQISHTELGRKCITNKAVGLVTEDVKAVKNFYGNLKGGLLAEEMGLGKTLEIISLICLHPMPHTLSTDPSSDLKTSPATLIITPPTIVEQWKQELEGHAPTLRVFRYNGISSYKKNQEEVMKRLLESDVVLTTYNVIAKEVHYVSEKPDRKLRGRPRADPPKSPLVQLSWWRVCLDEAQMVESGVSSAATVALRIPRENAWAVTGTPLKKDHKDLFGLFLFLRYEPFCQSLRIWDHLVNFHRPLLRSALSKIAMRHTKDFVREDLRLPPQSRHTITIPFTTIEEQHYSQLFAELCEECGLDDSGAPLSGDWDPNSPSVIEKMRNWLTRLRQTCLHPEIGVVNSRALRRTDGVLRTVEQVLDAMTDQALGQLRTAQRTWLMGLLRRGQMKQNASETQDALDIWKHAYEELCALVRDCRKQYNEELALRGNDDNISVEGLEEEIAEEESPQFNASKARLRSALELQHMCIFFIGDAYFQLKSPEEPGSDKYSELERQETQAYEEAKSIRSELLSEFLKIAKKLIAGIASKIVDARTQIPQMIAPDGYQGIESRKIFERLEIFCDAMNIQAAQFGELQNSMVGLLRQALLDQDDGVELQGDEYENSTIQQDQMYAYMEALRALFADRNEALSGYSNNLIRMEMQQFLNAAKSDDPNVQKPPAPELMIKLLTERLTKRVNWEKIGSLRGIIAEIRALIQSLEWQAGLGSARASHELTIINPVLQSAIDLNSVQVKCMSSLEQLVNHFRDTMNSRLEFYRALQRISDMVAPWMEETIGKPLNKAHYKASTEQDAKMKNKVDSLSTRLRYLVHLKTDSQSSAPRICIICQCDFEIGTLTVCGHQFCKECILLWLEAHHNCPVCKRRLQRNDFFDITYKPAEVVVQAEQSVIDDPAQGSNAAHSPKQSIYSDISASMLNQIKAIDIQGPSFGSKVDFLCRHLLWLRRHDPSSKAIVFSQYREFLEVLAQALREYKISFTSINEKNGIEKFKSDPTMGCFLLPGKAHSTGLNLVVANHVFLCEPLINTAIELQAIARVHRIGQKRPTTVWMYLIADTVEESIYDISVSKRLAHMRSKRTANTSGSNSGTATPTTASAQQQEAAIEMANSLELQTADLSRLFVTGRTGGEMVENADLWPCLFSRVKKRERVLAGVAGMAANQGSSSAVEQEANRFLRAEAADARRS